MTVRLDENSQTLNEVLRAVRIRQIQGQGLIEDIHHRQVGIRSECSKRLTCPFVQLSSFRLGNPAIQGFAFQLPLFDIGHLLHPLRPRPARESVVGDQVSVEEVPADEPPDGVAHLGESS